MVVKKPEALNNLSERRVVEVWQRLLSDQTELATQDGEQIRIVYPGRINDDRGADFRDAVIATKRGLVKGDIEIHVKASDWQAHQHNRDPAYNGVILHVAMWDDSGSATNLAGKCIPLLALDRFLQSQTFPPSSLGMPCLNAAGCLTTDAMAELLDTAGDERFIAKSAKFQQELTETEASQTLYQGIMGALGYSKNKLPCLELARRLPLQLLESMTKGELSDEEYLARQQALLLGTAGLLPSQRPNRLVSRDKWTDKLERLWTSSSLTEAMPYSAWSLFKVRPNNFPVRRIAAMSYLLLHYRESGLLVGLINIVKGAPIDSGCRRLEEGLKVNAIGYWASHFDFGLCTRSKSPLIGAARASDIAVNVILPFAFAWSQLNHQPEFADKASAIYRDYPRLAANAAEKHMRHQLGLSNHLVNSARRQQGLIHIYNTLCTQGRCEVCPINQ